MGRIPGLNIAETESSGFTANGIAIRGLNPVQSIEMNTRQNGYNISADPIAGYILPYTLIDVSATYKIRNYNIKAGGDNLMNHYPSLGNNKRFRFLWLKLKDHQVI